jgi:hypothetical protein
MMPQIEIGSLVRAQGERLLSRVVAIRNGWAHCEQLRDGTKSWYALAHLLPETLGAPLKTHLL